MVLGISVIKFLKNMVTPTLGKNKKDSLNIENLI